MEEYNIEMYGLSKFDKEKRTSFRLSGSPYDSEEAREELRTLGVIFFRDTKHSHGMMIQPDDGPPLRERRGFDAFYFRAICDEEDCEPQVWERENQVIEEGTITVEEYVKKHGDDRAWLFFNSPVHILKVTPTIVQVS